MGSGKTAVAQSLAAKLTIPMIDLDNFITEDTGRTPAEIIIQDGEPAFRSIETAALSRVLQANRARVIALGGGTWIEEANRKLIDSSHCLTIWLDTPFDECWRRIQQSGENRPLGKTERQAREVFERRRPIYRLATIQVKVETDDTVADVVAHIKRAIQ